jgi:thiol:disulfide interchange protein DsbC
MYRMFLFVLLAAAAVAYADDNSRQAVIDGLHKVVPTAKVQSVGPAPMAGFSTVVVDGHVVFISDDGKYLVEGHVIDIDAHRDITNDGLAVVRREGIAQIPAAQKLTFAPANPKYRVTVFTDVDCPYCRQFHKQIAEYNRLGIAVDYVLFPLKIHPGADKKAVTVWCNKDRNTAYTSAMNGENLAPKTCDNPVGELTSIALSMGVDGTPAIFAGDGTQLGGFVAPQDLAQRLAQMAQAHRPTAGTQ